MKSKLLLPGTLRIFAASITMFPCLSVDESPWRLPTIIVLTALLIFGVFSFLAKLLPKKLAMIFLLLLLFILAEQGQTLLSLPVFWILSALILSFSAGSVSDLRWAALSWKGHIRTCYLFWIFSNGFILIGESWALWMCAHIWSQPAATMVLLGFWILVWDQWLLPMFEKQESTS